MSHIRGDLPLRLCVFLAELFSEISLAAEALVCIDGVGRGRAHERKRTEFDVEADWEIAASVDGIVEGLVHYVAEAANLETMRRSNG